MRDSFGGIQVEELPCLSRLLAEPGGGGHAQGVIHTYLGTRATKDEARQIIEELRRVVSEPKGSLLEKSFCVKLLYDWFPILWELNVPVRCRSLLERLMYMDHPARLMPWHSSLFLASTLDLEDLISLWRKVESSSQASLEAPSSAKVGNLAGAVASGILCFLRPEDCPRSDRVVSTGSVPDMGDGFWQSLIAHTAFFCGYSMVGAEELAHRAIEMPALHSWASMDFDRGFQLRHAALAARTLGEEGAAFLHLYEMLLSSSEVGK